MTKLKVGEIKNFYTVKKDIIGKIEKNAPFYIVEDTIIMETDKAMILYILGNNE